MFQSNKESRHNKLNMDQSNKKTVQNRFNTLLTPIQVESTSNVFTKSNTKTNSILKQNIVDFNQEKNQNSNMFLKDKMQSVPQSPTLNKAYKIQENEFPTLSKSKNLNNNKPQNQQQNKQQNKQQNQYIDIAKIGESNLIKRKLQEQKKLLENKNTATMLVIPKKTCHIYQDDIDLFKRKKCIRTREDRLYEKEQAEQIIEEMRNVMKNDEEFYEWYDEFIYTNKLKFVVNNKDAKYNENEESDNDDYYDNYY